MVVGSASSIPSFYYLITTTARQVLQADKNSAFEEAAAKLAINVV